MRDFDFVRDSHGDGWISNHINGLMYPMFNHPEIDESSTEEEMKAVCDKMDEDLANGIW